MTPADPAGRRRHRAIRRSTGAPTGSTTRRRAPSSEEELAEQDHGGARAWSNLEEDFYAFGLRTKLSDATDGEERGDVPQRAPHVPRAADQGATMPPTSSPSS